MTISGRSAPVTYHAANNNRRTDAVIMGTFWFWCPAVPLVKSLVSAGVLAADTQDLTNGCPIMVGHPECSQIISNSHSTFAYLRTMSIQNSSCDTNRSKWLIVDFESLKA